MIMDIEQARKFGQMEGRLDALEDTVVEMRKQNLRMEGKVDKVVQALSSNAGGKAMLITMLTIAGTLGAFVTRIWEALAR